MRRCPVAETGLELTELGFGAGPLGGFYGPIEPEAALATVRTAWAAGIRYFDVAPLYGHGRAELLLGTVLRELPRDELVVSTKVGRWLAPVGPDGAGPRPDGLPFRPVLDYSRDGVVRSLEQSMLRLGLSRVDMVLIHDVDAHAQGSADAAEAEFRAAVEGAYPTLVELKRAGFIRAIGIGLNQVDWALRWLAAVDLDAVMIAGRYTLLNREAETELLPECARRGVAVLAAGAFNGGLLARGAGPAARFNYRPAPDAILGRLRQLESLASSWQVDLATAAVGFVLRHPTVTSLVTGAMSPIEITANVQAIDHVVPEGFWAAVDTLW